MATELPQTTTEGEPARAWCHLCDPVQAFKSIDDCNLHMKQTYGKAHDRRENGNNANLQP